VSDAGYRPARFDALRARLAARLASRLGPSLDGSGGALVGQLGALAALRLAQSAERVERYRSVLDPDAAVGNDLTELVKLRGLTRDPAELDSALRPRGEDHVTVPTRTSFERLYRELVALDDVLDVAINTHDSGTLTALPAGFGGAGGLELSVLSAESSTVWGDSVSAVLLRHLIGGVVVETNDTPVVISADDSKGRTHSFDVTVPAQVQIDLTINLTTNSAYPSNGDTLVKSAALPPSPEAFTLTPDAIHVGRFGYPVVIAQVTCRVRDAVPGIESVEVLAAVNPEPPVAFDISIDPREVALWDVDNFTVNS
jgi:hypothetical protein